MTIFSFQEKQNSQDTNGNMPVQINADVLNALNLTQTDIDSHYKNIAVENAKKEVAQEAVSYYQEASSGSISFADPKPIKLGQIALKPQVQQITEIPDSLFAQFKKIESAMSPDDKTHTKIYLETFAANFGQKALEAKDWQTAVNSYDLATEGGIIHASEVIKQLGEIYKDDTETRRQIAELIQKRINTVSLNIKPNETASTNQIPQPPIISTPSPEIGTPTPSITTDTTLREPLIQPVGTPTNPILGEKNLRPAPPNPSNTLT